MLDPMKAQDRYTPHDEHLLILGLVLMALVGSFVLQPCQDLGLCLPVPVVDVQVKLPETCMSQRILGISCPGCGLTRSFVALAHGDPRTAYWFNPMGPVLFVVFVLQIPYRIIEYFGIWRSLPLWERFKKRLDLITYILAAGLVACWVVKLAMMFL